MGKKSRLKKERQGGAAPEEPSVAQQVDRFLRGINAPGTVTDPAEFWDWLDSRNGAESAHLSDVLDGLVDDTKWGARSATLRLSIDHQFGFSGRLYRPLLRALAQRLATIGYRSVLDVGCENGLVGCFAASIRDDARLVGLDIEARALNSASELAGQLGLEASFVEADITAPDWNVSDDFDVVLSMRALVGNALGQRELATDDKQLSETLSRVRARMRKDGRYFAFERLANAGLSHLFASVAAGEGFELDEDLSTVLVVEEIPGTVERIPLLVFRPAENAAPPSLTHIEQLHERAARIAGASS